MTLKINDKYLQIWKNALLITRCKPNFAQKVHLDKNVEWRAKHGSAAIPLAVMAIKKTSKKKRLKWLSL